MGARARPGKRLGWLLAVVLLPGGGCGRRPVRSPSPPGAPGPAAKKPPPHRAGVPAAEPQSAAEAGLERAVWQQINAARQARGLAPLARSEPLTRLARAYSREMASGNFFSHDSPAGTTMVSRAERARINYQMLGENLFKSVNVPPERLARTAVDGWMKSPGHRKNILTRQFTETGVGVWRTGRTYYFTQEFMRPFPGR